MSYEWAVPGAKVVCVADTPRLFDHLYPRSIRWDDRDDMGGLTCGEVYTIRYVDICSYTGCVLVWLNEIVRTPDDDFDDPPFNVQRFRPLVTRTQEQDVLLFRELLTPSTDDIVIENALSLLDECEDELEKAWADDSA